MARGCCDIHWWWIHGAPLDKDGQRDSLWLDSLYKLEREASMAAEQAIYQLLLQLKI